jgi:glucosyl-dolichyl phosphate glucuronosyltransferase
MTGRRTLLAERPNDLDVSVVICTYSLDRWQCLVDAVRSVQRQTIPPREVITVADYNEELLERMQRCLPGVTAIPNSAERGAGGARNTGVKAAAGSIVAFLDDDAVAVPDWIEQLLGPISNPNTLGVGGEVAPEWLAPMPRWFPREFGWVLGCSYRGLPESTSSLRNLAAGNMAVRKDVFLELEGFREGHGNVRCDVGRPEHAKRRRFVTRQSGCEETDFCIRALRRWPGSVWTYHPPMKIYHRVPAEHLSCKYFLARCNDEGLAKATVVVEFSGSKLGLASERSYVRETLPRGIHMGVKDFFSGDPWGLARSGAIFIGFSVTALAFLRGRLSTIAICPSRER